MDKYQNYLLEYISISTNHTNEKRLSKFEFDKNKIIVTQNENYNITKYEIKIAMIAISKVEYLVGNKYIEAQNPEPYIYYVEIDFEKRTKEIKIYFDHDFAEPVTIPVEYIEADKKKYDEKVKLQLKKELEKKVNIETKTGEDIITIMFNPVSDKYSYSKIELYRNNITPRQLMAKYQTDKDTYFYSIGNLAYGMYGIIVTQYDSSNNEIYKSDYQSVVLRPASYRNSVTPHF